jgi:hypothetical protein
MMTKDCPNFKTCKLVNGDKVVPDPAEKEAYIEAYCRREESWRSCARYVTRKALWFCPDWVLPDSNMTEEEIIIRAEEEMEKQKEKEAGTAT